MLTENTTENRGRPIDVDAHRRALAEEIAIVRSLTTKVNEDPCYFACEIQGALNLVQRIAKHLDRALQHRALVTANRF